MYYMLIKKDYSQCLIIDFIENNNFVAWAPLKNTDDFSISSNISLGRYQSYRLFCEDNPNYIHFPIGESIPKNLAEIKDKFPEYFI